MLIFKSFSRWAKKIGISDAKLGSTIMEMERGLFDADLGRSLFKKRISLNNSGKRDGVRTIIAYKNKQKAYFLYGFAKNEKDNISLTEMETLQRYGEILMRLDGYQLKKSVINGEIIEVLYE